MDTSTTLDALDKRNTLHHFAFCTVDRCSLRPWACDAKQVFLYRALYTRTCIDVAHRSSGGQCSWLQSAATWPPVSMARSSSGYPSNRARRSPHHSLTLPTATGSTSPAACGAAAVASTMCGAAGAAGTGALAASVAECAAFSAARSASTSSRRPLFWSCSSYSRQDKCANLFRLHHPPHDSTQHTARTHSSAHPSAACEVR